MAQSHGPGSRDGGGLPQIPPGHHETLHPLLVSGGHRRQNPGHRLNPSVEQQLSHAEEGILARRIDLTRGREYSRGDGQIVRSTLLLQIRRGKIHQDSVRGELITAAPDCHANPLPGFTHGAVGQSHDIQSGYSPADIHFHGHQPPGEPRCGVCIDSHDSTPRLITARRGEFL